MKNPEKSFRGHKGVGSCLHKPHCLRQAGGKGLDEPNKGVAGCLPDPAGSGVTYRDFQRRGLSFFLKRLGRLRYTGPSPSYLRLSPGLL